MAEQPTAATACLEGLLQGLRDLQGNQRTLACYRLLEKGDEIRVALEEFASSSPNDAMHESDVLDLFRLLNDTMWLQDQHVWPELLQRQPKSNKVSIVFGGKFSKQPRSISEKLVQLLAAASSGASSKVYTVSRSTLSSSSLPNNVVHITKNNLEIADTGADEFYSVLQQAQADVAPDDTTTLTVYFTLGRHTGTHPFARNVAAVDNLCQALERLDSRHVCIVLTGTDATNPSTHPDGIVTIDGQNYALPTYKIFKYNYVYAMSKLYQFYKIADTVISIVMPNVDESKREQLQKVATECNIRDVLSKMRAHMDAVGTHGAYDEEAQNVLDMPQLDVISHNCSKVEQALKPYMHVAKGISICYTPLHAVPWTQNAIQQQHPRAIMLEQVVRRMKNAISTEAAARLHFLAET